MLPTGTDDFKDVIVPLLSGTDPHHRFGTYRTWDEFHLSCLGPNWAETVGEWNEAARVGFVSEFIRRRYALEFCRLRAFGPESVGKNCRR